MFYNPNSCLNIGNAFGYCCKNCKKSELTTVFPRGILIGFVASGPCKPLISSPFAVIVYAPSSQVCVNVTAVPDAA